MQVGYARLSSQDGEEHGSLLAQKQRLETLGCELVLSDVESGASRAREGFLRLRELIADGTASEVWAKHPDRLGRDAPHVMEVTREALARGVAIRFYDAPDLSQFPGQQGSSIAFDLLAVVADAERQRIRSRIAAGIKEAQAAGKHRNRVPYGYQRVDGRLLPHPVDWGKAQQLVALLERRRWSAHAALLDARALTGRQWTASGLRNWVLSPSLRGGVGNGQSKAGVYDLIHWGQHEALLSEQQQRDARQSIEANRRRVGGGVKQRVSGLVRCVHCGYACSLQSQDGGRYRYARCNQQDCRGYLKAMRVEEVEDAVAAAIVRQTDAWLSQVVTDTLPRARSPELQALEEELLELRPLLRRGLKVYAQRAAELEAQIAMLTANPQEDSSKRLREFVELWAGDIKSGELWRWVEDQEDRAAGADGVIGQLFSALVSEVQVDGMEKRVEGVELREAPILGGLLRAGEVPGGDVPAAMHGTVFERLWRALAA